MIKKKSEEEYIEPDVLSMSTAELILEGFEEVPDYYEEAPEKEAEARDEESGAEDEEFEDDEDFEDEGNLEVEEEFLDGGNIEVDDEYEDFEGEGFEEFDEEDGFEGEGSEGEFGEEFEGDGFEGEVEGSGSLEGKFREEFEGEEYDEPEEEYGWLDEDEEVVEEDGEYGFVEEPVEEVVEEYEEAGEEYVDYETDEEIAEEGFEEAAEDEGWLDEDEEPEPVREEIPEEKASKKETPQKEPDRKERARKEKPGKEEPKKEDTKKEPHRKERVKKEPDNKEPNKREHGWRKPARGAAAGVIAGGFAETNAENEGWLDEEDENPEYNENSELDESEYYESGDELVSGEENIEVSDAEIAEELRRRNASRDFSPVKEPEDYDEDYRGDYDDDEDDDEPGGSGVIWKVLIGVSAAIVVILVVAIGYILHSKGLLFNKGGETTEVTADLEDGADGQDESPVVTDTEQDDTASGDAADAQDTDASGDVDTADDVDGEKAGYEETSYENSVEVGIEAVSILKDLKVKFLNKSTGKLIANIPFEIEVSFPDGTSAVWSDSDKDGIIYYTDLAGGAYTLKAKELSDEKYKGYAFSGSKVAEVKEEIAYKAVEIADEVLDAGQVDEGAEDTARNGADTGGQTEVISAVEEVTDTVAFVESTKTDTYEEVDKSQIVYTPSSQVMPLTGADGSGNTGGDNSGSSGGDGSGTGDGSGESSDASKYSITVEKSETEIAAGSTAEIGAKLEGVELSDVTVTSSDSSIATAMLGMEGKIVITGVSGGKVTVRIGMLSRPEINAAISVTVIGNEQGDGSDSGTTDSNKLKFADGSQVYVYENGIYREADKADYDTFTQFFRLKSTYTGWQTISGATYYYTTDGYAVTGSQVIQGKEYSFDENGKLISGGNDASSGGNYGGGTLGIDVSKWNGDIDWQKVKNAGIGYAIIRIGYRGSSKGSLVDDAKFKTNIAGAQSVGIKVGVYFFSQAVNEVEAVEEASMVIDRLSGYSLSLPVYLDVEASGGRGDKIDVATRTAVCKTFCQTIQNAGYSAGIYANKNWLTEKINTSELSSYSIWVAHYNDTCGYTGTHSMWQYTDKGNVDGISGEVDLDKVYF